MSSLKNYLRKNFGKSHRYETQADLKDMTAEQIVNIEPKDVGYYIEQETGGVPLEGVKKDAMTTLLFIKQYNKKRPNETARQRAITSFLDRVKIKSNPEVDRLIADTRAEMAEKDMEEVRKEVDRKDMTNRLRALKNLPPSEIYTEEESMVKRLNALKAGKRRTVSKGKRREKTRKGRKGRKGRKTNRRR
jgi:hypothetical protein